MKLLRSLGGALSLLLLASLLVSVPAGAQTLTALQVERSIALSNILTTITPAGLPASVLAALAAGALDLREETNYNPQTNSLTSTTFVVTTGATSPTNLINVPGSSLIAQVSIGIDKIYITSSTVQIVGTINQSTTTPYGNYQGYPAVYSFGYTKDSPPKINNVVDSVAGTIVVYSAAGSGTFTIVQPSTGGGGGGGTGITISINGQTGATPSFQTTVNQIVLNASASTSTNAGGLTYAWTVTQGAASVTGGSTSTVNVQLGSGKITYILKLTITDSTGATSTATITIQYV
jgi:hypothetical protein